MRVRIAALTAAVLVSILCLPAPAGGETADPHALEPSATAGAPNLVMMREVGQYVHAHHERFGRVLHVDIEHMSSRGFWYAVEGSADDRTRPMTWLFKEFGVRCRPDFVMAFNPWMNTYQCMFNVDAEAAARPDQRYEYGTERCRTTEQLPFSIGWANGVDPTAYVCSNAYLHRDVYDGAFVGATTYAICAPWEDHGRTLHADLPDCAFHEYPWMEEPEPLPWLPAPDVCTRVPQDANSTLAYVEDFGWDAYPELSEPNPDCDGSANAPNCVPESAWHPACGGPQAFPTFRGLGYNHDFVDQTPPLPDPEEPVTPEPTTYTATFTATATSREGFATQEKTKTERVKAMNGILRATVRKTIDGRVFAVTRKAKVFHTAVGTATREVTVTWESRVATATWTCEDYALVTAQQCAEDEATRRAQDVADDLARQEARLRAGGLAQRAARAAAREEAGALARSEKPTSAERALAERQALARAKKALKKAIRQHRDREA